MLQFFRRALGDILANRFLNTVTVITIALSVLIIGVFALFFINADALMDSWKKGIRIMAYLDSATPEQKISEIKASVERIKGIESVRFISKKEALEQLKSQMTHQSSLFENLKENPLPDAFEIQMAELSRNREDFEAAASRIAALPSVQEVEYGQKWLERFSDMLNLFKAAGYAMGGLFFLAAVFFVANTIRLVIYSRRDEIEIMRLVGASESFIKDPFYIQSLIQGAIGGMIGTGALFAVFRFVTGEWRLEIGNWKLETASNFNFLFSNFHLRFLPSEVLAGILLGSMFVGWLGCYLSLKQFLKL
jgi:cell division transport system permease protein